MSYVPLNFSYICIMSGTSWGYSSPSVIFLVFSVLLHTYFCFWYLVTQLVSCYISFCVTYTIILTYLQQKLFRKHIDKRIAHNVFSWASVTPEFYLIKLFSFIEIFNIFILMIQSLKTYLYHIFLMLYVVNC